MGCSCLYGDSDDSNPERRSTFKKIQKNERENNNNNNNETNKKEDNEQISFNVGNYNEIKNEEKVNNGFANFDKKKEKDEETNYNKHEKIIINDNEEKEGDKEINIKVEENNILKNEEDNINLKSGNIANNDEEKKIKDFEEENIINYNEEKKIKNYEEENNEEEDKKEKENEETTDSQWREYMKDDNNFDQKVPFDFNSIFIKLQKAATNPEKLNPFYTISAIYDFTKIFKSISSALSMGFSDITEKCQLMRKRFEDFPEAEYIQDLLNKEIELGIHQLNGDNNKSLGHKKDEYAKYISGCRTYLRLQWFLEYLIDIFENVLKDDGNGKVKTVLGDSYNKVLAPHHTFLVRKAVGMALSFSSAGNVANVVELIFGFKDFNEEAKKVIRDTTDLMQKIWNGGNVFYVQNQLLDLK